MFVHSSVLVDSSESFNDRGGGGGRGVVLIVGEGAGGEVTISIHSGLVNGSIPGCKVAYLVVKPENVEIFLFIPTSGWM